MLAVLDEISGFASEVATGNEQGKTADNIYKAFRGSVDSRFPDLGKVVLLSFPRYNGDFISERYEAVIADKEVVSKNHKFIINPLLPEDDKDNWFEISWDEDHIKSYKYPGVFALKRPTWEVNPTRKIDDFKIAFMTDLGDAMMRFACVPTYASDAFFKQADKVRACMTIRNPLDQFRRFEENFNRLKKLRKTKTKKPPQQSTTPKGSANTTRRGSKYEKVVESLVLNQGVSQKEVLLDILEHSERQMKINQELMQKEIDDFISKSIKEMNDAIDELRLSYLEDLKEVDGILWIIVKKTFSLI